MQFVRIALPKGFKYHTKIKNSLRKFKGVKRRFSIIFNNTKNMVIDDYAHHPAEIEVTLKSLKSITKKVNCNI